MKSRTVIAVLALALGTACSSSDNNANSSANGTTGPNNNTAGNNTSPGSGEFLRATGTINGDAFSVDCDPDDEMTSSFTSGVYRGHDQCIGSVGAHAIVCHTAEEGLGGLMGTTVLNIGVNTADEDMVSLTASLEPVLGLRSNSPNVTENTVTIDMFEPDVGASGSFSAAWDDDGGGIYGDVSGTFNFNCDE